MANATATPPPSKTPAKSYGMLRQGPKATIAYKVTLLDAAILRSNAPDEVLSRTYGGADYFVCPDSKLKHAMREVMERICRSLNICPTCRAQHYCGECPSCFVGGTFGGVGENKKDWSLQSKVDFTELVALKPGVDTVEVRTVNSVDPVTQKTNTSLTRKLGVPHGTEFYGMVSIWNPSEDALKLVVGSLLEITRVGACTAINGLCKVEILGIREAFKEPVAWAPMTVTLAGSLPAFTLEEAKRAPFTDMDDPKQEKELIAAVLRFHEEVVQPIVADLRGKVSMVARDVKAVIEALNRFEAKSMPAGTAVTAIEKGLKSILKTELEDVVKDLLADIAKQYGEAQKKAKVQQSNAPLNAVISDTLVDLREAMQSVVSV